MGREKKLKVLVATNMYPYPGHPYAGIFVYDQVKSLRAIGVDVDVFFVNGFADKKNYLLAPFRLYKILKRKRYDLVHSHHSYVTLITWFVRFFVGRKIPLLFTFHESEFLKPKGFIPKKRGLLGKLILSGKLKKFALNRADYVITVWDGLVKSLGYKKTYETIPCGIDLKKFKPIDRKKAREKLGWPQEEQILFFPGDRRREKGTDLIEEAVKILEEKGYNLKVVYAENIPHDDMPFYMAAADAVVHPSRFEASPMVIKEAMGVGTPLVTTTVGDVGDIAKDVEGALFVGFDPVEIAEKIEVALKMKPSHKGREKLNSLGLSLEDVAKRILELYRRFVSPIPKSEERMGHKEKDSVAVIRCGYFPDDPRVYKEVLALREMGLNVEIFCLNQGDELSFESKDGVKIFRLGKQHCRKSIITYLWEYLGFLVWSSYNATKRHLKVRYRVVQVHTLPDFLVFAALPVKFLGAKVVLDMHEVTPELFSSEYTGPLKSLFFEVLMFIEKISMATANHVFCPGPSVIEIFVSRWGPLKKISFVYNAPTENIFNLQETKIKKIPFLVVAHGTIIERYGFQTLIMSIPTILSEIKDATFEIFGDGEYLPELKKLAKDLNIEDKVYFHGKVPLAKIPQLISRGEVGVVATLKNEYTVLLSPNKVFEFASLRIPIVASDLKGVRRQFGDSIVYFKPGDPEDLAKKVVMVLKSKELREKLSEEAYKVYEGVRWNKNKRDYQRIYQEILETQKGRNRRVKID